MAALDSKTDRLRRWLDRGTAIYPLGFGAIFAVIGIVIADRLPSGLTTWPVMVTGGVCLTFGLIWRRAGFGLAGTASLFVALHSGTLEESRDHPLRRQLLEWQAPVAATVEGTLVPDRPSTSPGSAPTGILFAQRIGIRHSPAIDPVVPARLRVLFPKDMEIPVATVRCAGRLFLPSSPSLPSDFDRDEQLWRDGFVGILRVQRMERLAGAGWSAQTRSGFIAIADRCRLWIIDALTLDLDNAPEQTAVIRGMVMGDPGTEGASVEKTFRDSGTLHLFAVSGLHVGLIAMVAWVLLRWLPIHRTPRLALLIILVFAYAFVTGWRPSAARAAWMIALMLSAGLFTRRANLFNNLGVAGLVLLTLDTQQLFRPGFQLSFGVLLAIILITPWSLKKMAAWLELDPFLPRQLATPSQLMAEKFRQWAASTVVVSAAAWIGSFPLMLWHFQSVAPIGILANCLLVPLAFGALLTSCLSLCAAGLQFAGLQVMLNNANWCFASLILTLTGGFSEAPGSRFVWTDPSASAPRDETVEGVFFDLPNGGASMLIRVGEKSWLWDTGTQQDFRFTVQPHLERQGIHRLDGLILSHNDIQHVGGAEAAVEALYPKSLIHSLHEPWSYDSGVSVLPSLLSHLTMPTERMGRHDRLQLGRFPAPFLDIHTNHVTAEVLYPGAKDLFDRADDRSLVWRIEIGPFKVLWLPDAGFNTEKSLLESGINLKSDLLIHTQHATDPGGLPEFLHRARPRIVISSNEFHLPEEHPPERWLRACEAMGVPRWNAREKGAIVWRLLPSGEMIVSAPRSGETLRLAGQER